MDEEIIQVSVRPDVTVTAIRTMPDAQPARSLFIYAPGAGSNNNDPFGSYLRQRMVHEGIALVRFQFPYMEARKRRPDSPALLEETWNHVIETVRMPDAKLIVGGRSMGGRIASHVAAQGTAVDALALFAYPLHPPGHPTKSRDLHLPEITSPTLFCSGTRDEFATPEELATAAATVPRATVHTLEGADHGFSVLKSSGRSRDDVWGEVTDFLLSWLETQI
jgi:predicted alpha/beta-hydrolase family hydrolase